MRECKLVFMSIMIMLIFSGCGKEAASNDSKEYEVQFSEVNTENRKYADAYYLTESTLYFAETGQESNCIQSLTVGEKTPEVFLKIEKNDRLLDFVILEHKETVCIVRKNDSEDIDLNENRFVLQKYDAQGSLIWEKPAEHTENCKFVVQLQLNPEGKIVLASEQEVLWYSAEGEYQGKAESEENQIENMAVDETGELYIVTVKVKEKELLKLSFSGGSLHPVKKLGSEFRLLDSNTGIYFTDNENIYYFDGKSGKEEQIISLTGNNISGNMMRCVTKKDDTYIVGTWGMENGEKIELAVLAPKTEFSEASEEPVEKEVIDFATTDAMSRYQNSVTSFNRTNLRYQINLKKYSKDFEERMNQINADFMTAEAPDVIEVLAGYSNEYYNNYVQNGYLEDLTSYLEQSEKLKKEDFTERVFEDFSVDGRLYGIPTDFTLQTLACSQELIGDRTSWNMEEFLDFLEEYPNAYNEPGWQADSIRSSILEMVMYRGIYGFVNFDEGKAYFDEGRFGKLLKRIKELNIQAVSESREVRCAEGEAVLWNVNLYSVRDLQQAEWKNGQGKKLALIGFPSGEEKRESGALLCYSGLLAINSSSEQKEGAWQFLEGQLVKALVVPKINFPTGKMALEETLMLETEVVYLTNDDGSYVLDKNGQKIENFSTINGVPYPAITMEQVEKVRKAIETAHYFQTVERTLTAVVTEEATMYFGGSRSLDETVKIIQNRIQLYLDGQ